MAYEPEGLSFCVVDRTGGSTAARGLTLLMMPFSQPHSRTPAVLVDELDPSGL
jgi:hypothetical protein